MELHETLNVLFDYFKSSKHTMHLKTDFYYLENVRIRDYAYMEELPNTLSFSLGHIWDELSKETLLSASNILWHWTASLAIPAVSRVRPPTVRQRRKREFEGTFLWQEYLLID